MFRIMELRLGDKFKLIKKIGSGAFGEIYKGKCRGLPFYSLIGQNIQTGEDVAVKLVSACYQ
jgi:serine/threonine protein kinase